MIVEKRSELGRANPRVQLMLGWRKPLLKLRLLQRVLYALAHFKRHGRFVGMFPWTVQIQTRSDCNSACRICPHRIVEKLLPQGEMPRPLFEKIVAECARVPHFSGYGLSLQNEPLVDPRLVDLVAHIARERPAASRAVVFLATNGIELTPRTFERLVDAGLDFLQISINAYTREEYERLSPGRSYDTLRRNLDHLLAQDLSRIGVHLSFVRTRTNHAEVDQAVRVWLRRGIPAFVHHLSNRAGTLDTFEEYYLDAGELSAPKRLFRAFVRSVLPVCPYVFFQASVLFSGDVLLCTHDWKRQFVLGNVAEQSLSAIWNGERANEARRSWLEGRQDSLPPCRGCTVYRDLAFT
jgi:radical SAM protein with 4Fe4S-binding SPASM domain